MLFKLFITFFKIGAFTFGGGYAMIPLIQAEVVDKNKWLDSDEFLDILAACQSAPGAIAVNSATFIGFKIKGILGAITSLLGVVLPSFLIILIIALFLYEYRDNQIVEKMFLGIRPAVAALIFSAVYKLSKSSKINVRMGMIALAALLSIVLLDISPIVVILAGGLGAISYYKFNEKREKEDKG